MKKTILFLCLFCVSVYVVAQKNNTSLVIQRLESNMVSIQGGTFMMGSPESESDRQSDETKKEVSVSAFKIGKYEVTQVEWEAIMGSNPSSFENCPQCPVESVSYEDIVSDFLPKLKQITGKNYRLCTEEEWEYACRAGTNTPFSTGFKLSTAQANHCGSGPIRRRPEEIHREKTIKVGSFSANAFGLYDMHGNVDEWTSSLTKNGNSQVVRGGSFFALAVHCRSAYRSGMTSTVRSFMRGFRLCL